MAKLTVADVPHMLKMWDRERNTENSEDVSVRNGNSKYWKCPDCKYSWTASPYARYKSSGKCPCHESNKIIYHGVNDALTLVKGLAPFIDENNNFEEIYKQGVDSKMPVNFKCDECGRKWTATLVSQVKKNGNGGYFAKGCPHYNTVKRKKEDVPFCSEVESLMRFWDDTNPMDPTTTRSNINIPAHFICKNCGYDWTTRIRAQTRGTGKCMCCELQRVARKGVSDVFTLVPESQRFYDFSKNKGIDIYSITLKNKDINIDWKCPNCDKEWRSPLTARIKGKKGNYSFVGCRECYLHSKDRITPVASIPKLMKHWDFKKNRENGIDPNLTSAHDTLSAHWLCKACGYSWKASIKGRLSSDGKCPVCERTHLRSIVPGVNDVLTRCSELSKIYDFEYNEKKGIDIQREGVHSLTEARYKCPKCGNEWDSPICYRVKKNNNSTYSLVDCPVCSDKRFSKIPYSEKYPLLAKMYREDLNPIPLDSIRGHKAIHQTYYWNCLQCNEPFNSTLSSMIASQEKSTKGCPFCSNTRLRKGESFAELHSELMGEYNPKNTIDPYTVFPNRKDNVGWICRKCGYHWNASFALRHRGDGNCPICNRTVVISDKNSFAAVYPDLVKYWAASNERRADETFYNASLWLQFICPICDEEHGAYIEDFVVGDSCPYCKKIRLSPEINSLKVSHPDIAKRWSSNNDFGPDTLFSTSWEWAKWICDTCSCEYPARVKDVVNSNDECPYCAGKLAIPGKTSLKVLYPNIARLLSPNDEHDTDLMLPTAHSSHIWRCSEYNLDYVASTYEMINGYTCPYCDGRKVVPGKTSLKALYPDIAKLLSPIDRHDPDLIIPTAQTSYVWRCPEYNLDYNASAYEMINGYTCPYCDGRRAVPGKTSLKALYPDIAKLLSPIDGHDPDLIVPNVTTSYIWRCSKCNYDYNASVIDMINGYTCPYCNGRIVMPGFNSFGDKHPALIDEMDETANYLLPKSPYEVLDTSKYKFWFTCQKDIKHKYRMSPSTRLMFQKRNREPCLYCRGLRRKLNHFISD